MARIGQPPAYPFGFGLSYTEFRLSDISVIRESGSLRVQGTVHNTGALDGADVVQVYAELPDPDAPGRLIGFERVAVPAGGSEPFDITIPLDRLATRDARRHVWVPPAGTHRIRLARHAADSSGLTLEMPL